MPELVYHKAMVLQTLELSAKGLKATFKYADPELEQTPFTVTFDDTTLVHRLHIGQPFSLSLEAHD